ncbi:nucleolar preribosomal GTPase, putative [Plasmodium knowlesi strain H]|uniref:Nucleolar preribosomal GTPase, putative n=3 Tax=Plasmodium knowlesi TaxID=5850 RepID=A0A5K1V3Q1_PLAKH|nr:nucleolar preribosomal GTPase, putative [Plasmodium knowlesi strain H]OTN67120.1 putative Nucleolar preribosomal GTPase [Plasmodium knowlesi]CAA9988547.1 nucleolar preribosomal GTPase, putative [Plasmodium knowlesi strain H]SBO21334.1 nucleolar preribosomal GTPase, putative [Plasmodium knowlesi strain H]SBO21789.1 nucleolar preribosomal GTPase, putative [Plasmodium knowlesi strain H]VVS78021.1 nucleolar preribosomal GTPase, putative [Plasmodium knowlesi strain H]|eukprot:XP_002259523.1 hypothetical protein, conserved in Plasmodium species [Plasmodium knowlesi strain H]
MVKLGKTSKRQPLKQKYAITKKVAAHKKKLKKIIKKTKIHHRRSTKKSMKIPECIFKKDILSNIKINSSKKKNKNNGDEDTCKEFNLEQHDDCTLQNMMFHLGISSGETPSEELINVPMGTLLNSTLDGSTTCGSAPVGEVNPCSISFYNYLDLNFATKMHMFEKAKEEMYPSLNEKYLHVDNLLDIIRNCDALFYIIDVRNPLLYLEEDIIDFIKKCRKEVILILNKCDLVEVSLIQQWLHFFRNCFLTIPFICYRRQNLSYLVLGGNNTAPKLESGRSSSVPADSTNYKIFVKSLLKGLFNTDKKITYGVLGHTYTGRVSFTQSVLSAFSYTKSINKTTVINLDENINFHTKCGIILKKEIHGIGLIKRLHVLNNKERLNFLSEFLLNLTGKNLLKILTLLNREEIAYEYRDYFGKNKDKLQKLKRKKEIIRLILLKDPNEEPENKNINFKNMTKLYNKLFLNKIAYYVIPKTMLSLSHEKNDSVDHISSVGLAIYPNVDEFIFSQERKFDDFIIIKSDNMKG